MTRSTYALQIAIETCLRPIEQMLGPDYKLTLVCRHTANDGRDMDIVPTLDDAETITATVKKMLSRPAAGKEQQN